MRLAQWESKAPQGTLEAGVSKTLRILTLYRSVLTCLAYERPWVQSPAQHFKKNRALLWTEPNAELIQLPVGIRPWGNRKNTTVLCCGVLGGFSGKHSF